MSYFRVTEPNVSDVSIDDLGIIIGQNTVETLSNNFKIADLYLSADLEAAIIAGDLTVEIDYGTGFQSVAAVDYTNRDALASFLNVYEITNEDNNEDLVDGSEVNTSGPGGTPLHIHDLRYYTETEIGATTGAALVGADDTACVATYGVGSFATVQAAIEALCAFAASAADDLDSVYDNDADGVMNVDGSFDLDLKSNNTNDIAITRTDTTDDQDFLRADVSAEELLLGSPAVGGLGVVDVRVRTDLYVDGNITFVGTITDTTVTNMNVTNSEILLRDGAGAGGDASLLVERGVTGADAAICWDETTDRWGAGLVGSCTPIALLGEDEDVTGVWCFGGVDDTEPNYCMVEKDDTAPPSANLGAAGDTPVAMFPDGLLAVYDKSNSRNKWLSVERQFMYFTGRDNPNNSDEYARTVGVFTSNQTGIRLMRKATLIGISIQTNGAETWTAEVRKNSTLTVQASLAAAAVAGNHANTYNVDFAAGDEIQVYLNTSGTNVDRPVVVLEFAYLFAA